MSKLAWTQTYTGKMFYPFDPRPDDVCIEDIAHALAMQCRFNGHCREFYSVAQHSVIVSMNVPACDAMKGLLHDAAEAYVGDLVRPIKKHLPEFRVIEEAVHSAICLAFRIEPSLPNSVLWADRCALMTEKRDLMAKPPAEWEETAKPFTERIKPWLPALAERAFLERFVQLGGGRQ